MKKMKVQLLSLMFLLTSGSCGSDKKLHLIDLYACVDEFEDYCHQIPEWTVRAAIGLANDCSDILPGLTLSSLSKDLYPDKSLVSDGEIILTSRILGNFHGNLRSGLMKNANISPILLGSPFGFVSQYAVHILGEKLNFVQVNFRSTLISRSSFLYWIGSNEAFFNAVRLQLLLDNNWRRVGILSSSGTTSLTAEVLEKQLVEEKITVINAASFVIQGKITDSVWNVGQLAELKLYRKNLVMFCHHFTLRVSTEEEDVRIIIALLPMIEIPLIMCAAYDIGLIDDHHVWILPEINLNDMRRVAKQYNMCDVDIALRNALMMGENYHNFENHSLPFGTNDLDDLLIKYNNLSSDTNLTRIPGYNLSRVIFDATWAVILALNNSMQALAEKGLSLEGAVNQTGVNPKISTIMKESLNKVQFSGLSGMVDFRNRNNQNLTTGNNLMTNGSFDSVRISQIINNSSCTVEIYKASNGTELISIPNASFCSYTWGNDAPPSDGLIDHPQVTDGLLIFTIIATVIFIAISIALIVLTIALRKNKYMKTSSVSFNVMIIIGCMLVFMIGVPALLTYGAKQYNINEAEFSALCHVYCFLDKVGYLLVSITLLLKTWRLYQIKSNKLLKVKIRFISSKAMFILTVILLVPVMFLLIIQIIIDRPRLNTKLLEIEERYPYKYIEYSSCYQTFGVMWELMIVVYNIGILVCIFWQAGHVSQMKIKQLAREGDNSIRLLLLVVVVTVCHIFITVIFSFNGNNYAILVADILASMTFPVMTVTMMFSFKLYMIFKDYKQLTQTKRRIRRRKSSNLSCVSFATDITSL